MTSDNKSISSLDSATLPLSGEELLVIVQDGDTKNTPALTFVETDTSEVRIGENAVTGPLSIAIGLDSLVPDFAAIAIGLNARSYNAYSVALGYSTFALSQSIAIGGYANAGG